MSVREGARGTGHPGVRASGAMASGATFSGLGAVSVAVESRSSWGTLMVCGLWNPRTTGRHSLVSAKASAGAGVGLFVAGQNRRLPRKNKSNGDLGRGPGQAQQGAWQLFPFPVFFQREGRGLGRTLES